MCELMIKFKKEYIMVNSTKYFLEADENSINKIIVTKIIFEYIRKTDQYTYLLSRIYNSTPLYYCTHTIFQKI